MDWAILEKVGIAGIALGSLWIFYQIFLVFIKQWGASTEALNRNSQSYEQLSNVFGRAHEREMEFQKEMMNISLDTNNKVTALHRELIERGSSNQ